MSRARQLGRLERERDFDVAILGGGINGACLYDRLCRKGYKALLLDKRDFSSGSSQSSGMMIWGGLLYLRNLDVASVVRMSRDRERMIRELGRQLGPTELRYLPSRSGGRARWWVRSGLWLYWALGSGRRKRPASESDFREQSLLKPGVVDGSLTYEEAFVDASDARFVLHWITPHRGEGHVALNYCTTNGAYGARDGRWRLHVTDDLGGSTHEVSAALVVNCAGVWTDRVNAQFGIRSPFRHALSKGVYLALPRPPEHDSSLVFELGKHGDVITFVPWGPVSLWGPTETWVTEVEAGFEVTRHDVDYLLDEYARRFRRRAEPGDIVSLRCGLRPLVVDTDFKADRYPLDVSRRQEVLKDRERPWISCYGGKLTGCVRMAASAERLAATSVAPTGRASLPVPAGSAETSEFPTLPGAVPSPAWSRDHEFCCTLHDYLRRRTNIAQWTPRMGLGKHGEHETTLHRVAMAFAGNDVDAAGGMLDSYRRSVNGSFDRVLA